MCVRNGMVQPHDHVVVVQKVHDAFMIKVQPLPGTGVARTFSLLQSLSHKEQSALLRRQKASEWCPVSPKGCICCADRVGGPRRGRHREHPPAVPHRHDEGMLITLQPHSPFPASPCNTCQAAKPILMRDSASHAGWNFTLRCS